MSIEEMDRKIENGGLQGCSGGFLQLDVKLGDPEQNLAALRHGLSTLDIKPPGVVVMPEMWAAGFDYNGLEEHAGGTDDILEALKEEAAKYNIHLAGSLPESGEFLGRNCIYNTLYIVSPTGVAGSIRKQRLFAPMDEDKYFTAGKDPEPVMTDLGLVAGMVCFDLRFPEIARVQLAQGAQMLIVSAQWPAARRNHWKILLQARAIENQVFVIGCNRCGVSEGTEFGGHSMIIAPDGSILAEAEESTAAIAAWLDPGLLVKTRKLFTTFD